MTYTKIKLLRGIDGVAGLAPQGTDQFPLRGQATIEGQEDAKGILLPHKDKDGKDVRTRIPWHRIDFVTELVEPAKK